MGAWGKFKEGFKETRQASLAAADAKKTEIAAAVPTVGEGGVRYVGEEGYLTRYLLTVHDAHLERRKWDSPTDAPEILKLSAIVGVDIKLRWKAINDVTVKTSAGEQLWQFNKAEDATRLHSVLSDYLRGSAAP